MRVCVRVAEASRLCCSQCVPSVSHIVQYAVDTALVHISSHASAHNNAKPRSTVLTGSGEARRSGVKCARGRRSRLTTSEPGQTPAHLRAHLGENDRIQPPDVGWRAPGAERRRLDVGPRSAWPLKRRRLTEPPSAASAVGGRADARAVVLHPHADDLHTRSTQGSLSTSTGSDEMMARAAAQKKCWLGERERGRGMGVGQPHLREVIVPAPPTNSSASEHARRKRNEVDRAHS